MILWNHNPDTILTMGTCQDGLIYDAMPMMGSSSMTISKVLSHRQVVIDHMEALVARYDAQLPIYGRINGGSRKGSIVQIANNHITKKLASNWVDTYPGRTAVSQGYFSGDPRLYVRNIGQSNRFFSSNTGQILIQLSSWLEFGNPSVWAMELEFDGRKSITVNNSDLVQLELLPNYNGPTVYQFTKKTKSTIVPPVNLLAMTPLDMFGESLAIGDMFLYARNDELVIAKLKKVSEKAIITADSIMDNREIRIQGSWTLQCLKNGKPIPSLMKFNKNEALSQKLMLEKLKR